jgi:hypothetical protein
MGTANQAHTTTTTIAAPPSGSSTEVHDAGTAASLCGASTKVGTTAVTNVAKIPADDSSKKPPAQSTTIRKLVILELQFTLFVNYIFSLCHPILLHFVYFLIFQLRTRIWI